MTTAAHSGDLDADLVALARELIAKVRANGHDVTMDTGTMRFLLNVRKTVADVPPVREKGVPAFVMGVDLTPYWAIFESPRRDAIFAAALQGDA